MVTPTVKLAQRVTDADVEAALQDVDAACSCETANLLRAVFKGFRVLASGVRLATDIVTGIDEAGKTSLFLVMRFPEPEVAEPIKFTSEAQGQAGPMAPCGESS